jgi:hypothetical protein
MLVLPLVALGLLLAPQSVTDRARVWAGPVLAPLRNLTDGLTLDLAQQIRQDVPAAPSGEAELQSRVHSLENALAEATAVLADYDRRVRDLADLRESLGNLPCRLIPGRLMAPEAPGGRTGALLGQGLDKGVRGGDVLIRRDLDRGAREALSRGEPVLTAAGLVGVVDQVGPVTSTVRLLTDPRTSLMVQIITRRDGQWRPGPEGVCRGSGDGATLTVEGISRTSDVAPGDFIVTSPSPEAALPPYLVVGRVARCHLKPAALFYDLVVEPRVAAAEAGNVYVLSRPADETKP